MRRSGSERVVIVTASGGLFFGLDLALCDIWSGRSAADLDPARLHLFGNLALEFDRQQAVLQLSASDLHVVGQLEAALEELNPEQKTCITLFYLHKKSYQEIVSITGYNLLQVKSYIQNGKRNLKILVEKKMKQRK